MPRPSKGARLYPRRARERIGKRYPATWVILDGGHEHSTGCGLGDRAGAEKRLAEYLAEKHQAPRRERRISEIRIADVIAIYLTDVVPGLAKPQKAAERAERLLMWWGERTLSEVTGANCRAYASCRDGEGPSVRGGRKGTGGGARRDLQDLSAAIGHHHAEGLHREVVKVVLPAKGEARQRWLTRDEAARLLWACWRTREVQDGAPTKKRPLLHLVRFLLLGLYTGSRPGAILSASWVSGVGRSFVDLDSGVFHRRADGHAETNKRQPIVRISPRLLAHARRWRRMDMEEGKTWVIAYEGKPVASVKTALSRACKLAGIPDATAYALRHSCASWLVNSGKLTTREIADFIGTSEAMIVSHYGHLSPTFQLRASVEIGRK